MSAPTNGYVPAEFLAPIGNGLEAERNTAAALGRLVEAHPGVHTNGPASGYWSRNLDIDIHARPGAYGIGASESTRLSPSVDRPTGSEFGSTFQGAPSVAKQFGFSEFNPYTFTYDGPYSWDPTTPVAGLDLDEVAREVIKGDWGNGPTRAARLAAAGYDAAAVQGRVNALLGIAPAPVATVPVATVPVATVPVAAVPATPPTPVPATPATPVPATPTPKVPPMTTPAQTPTPAVSTAAQIKALQDDEAQLIASGGSTAPLAGLLAAHPIGRKRAYIGVAVASLLVSFGPDAVTYGVVTGSHVAPFVSIIGLSTSLVLKIAAAFGLVAASNAK